MALRVRASGPLPPPCVTQPATAMPPGLGGTRQLPRGTAGAVVFKPRVLAHAKEGWWLQRLNETYVLLRRAVNRIQTPRLRLEQKHKQKLPSSKPGHPLSRVPNVSVNYAGMSCLPAPRSRWSYPWPRALRCLLRPTELSAAAVQRRERRGRATTPQPGRRGRMRAGLRAVISPPLVPVTKLRPHRPAVGEDC